MRKAIVLSVVALIVVLGVYIFWNYFYVISDGYREGDLQKFSRKGNVFKTYEGEMVQMGFGARRNMPMGASYFYFSVTDDRVADSLIANLGSVVKLHYIQYRRSLPWRGEAYGTNQEAGQYVVDRIDAVKEVGY